MRDSIEGRGLPEIPTSLAFKLNELFSTQALAPHKDVAEFLGISTTWLRELGDRDLIRYCVKGTCHRIYAREHVESHLRRDLQYQSTDRKQKRARSNRRITTLISKSKSSVGGRRSGFSAAQARRRAAQQRHTKPA
jgi:hypothetical protein